MALLDLFFPRRCLGCGQLGSYFCRKCASEITLFHPQRCPKCKKPSLGGITHLGCREKEPLDGLIAIFAYGGIIRLAIGKLKYRFVSDLADELVNLIIRDSRRRPFLVSFLKDRKWSRSARWALVPIPLHWYRKNWRGFNQAELLGRKLADYFGWRMVSDLLIRQKRTPPQVELKADQRRKNIKGVFTINRHSEFLILNSQFLLFDDVWTTGATMKEAARVLKKAGVKKVWGLTIAR